MRLPAKGSELDDIRQRSIGAWCKGTQGLSKGLALRAKFKLVKKNFSKNTVVSENRYSKCQQDRNNNTIPVDGKFKNLHNNAVSMMKGV